MHKLAKEIMDRVKSKINTCGIDGITEQELIEMKYWTCIADAMTSYDYHYKIIEEMEKPENEYGVNYDENGKYYTPPRRSNGQFGQDMRKHYDEIYDPNPMYNRDMDLHNGRMYYTDIMGNASGINTYTQKSYSENYNPNYSRYERARRGYEEAKEMHPGTDNMDKLKDVFKELEDEMHELKSKMTMNEKTHARSKLTAMADDMM